MSYSVSVMMMKSRTGFFIFPSTLASSHIYDNVGGFFFIFYFFPSFYFLVSQNVNDKRVYMRAWNSWWIAGSFTHVQYISPPCHSFGLRYQFRSIPVYIPNCFADRFAQSIEWRRRRIPASPFLSIAQFQLQNYFPPPPHLLSRYSE
jgi:hypothetical protein